MHSLSVYRGQSDRGVGEGPGLEVEHGEQYLAADGPLLDPQLLAAIRPWMTLDLDPLDERALGGQMEAWSCFSQRGYSFVVRLAPAGKYDQRTAYFAHGRAWPHKVWDEGSDAYSCLGDAAAFDSPWRGSGRPPGSDPPLDRLTAIEKVQAAPQLAVRLLAHLLDASLDQRPLLMAVPVEDFRQGGRLVASIALARAALPFGLKRVCGLRVYTRRPRFFLQDAGARLAVVPQDEAESVRSLRGLTLLDRDADVEWGRQTAGQALDYAQRVVDLACSRPEGLFEFSRRVEALTSGSESLSGLDFEQLPRLYQISATTAQQLEDSVLETLPQPQDFPWESLTLGDLRQLSARALAEILLASDSAGRLSAVRQRTRQLVTAQDFPQVVRTQCEKLLEAKWPSKHPDAASQQSMEELSRLAAAGLVSDAFSASQSMKASLDLIAALQDPSALLEAEIRSGQLQKRRLGNPELSRLAWQPSLAGVLAEGVLRQALPSSWLDSWLRQAPIDGLTAFAARFIGRPESMRHRSDHYPMLLKRLLEQDSVAPELLKPLRQAVSQFEWPADFLPLLSALELGQRCGDPQSYQQLRRLWPRLSAIQGKDSRETLVRLCLDEDWKSLHPLLLVRQDGDLRLPAEWELDVAGLLLSADQLAGRLNLATLLRLDSLLDEAAQGESWKRLPRRIDELLAADDADKQSIVAQLLGSAAWTRWRQQSRLDPDLLREVALAWLSSPVWERREAPPVPIEAWDQVISDLKASPLSAPLIETLFKGQKPLWPWILPFQLQQLEDLARLCADWDALAALRERLFPQSIPYRLRESLSNVLQASFGFPAPLPDGFLDALIPQPDPQADLEVAVDSLRALFPPAGKTDPLGSRSDRLRAHLRPAAVRMLARDDKFRQGLETARLLKLEGDPGFGAQLAAVLNDRVETGQTSSLRDQDLDFLEKWLESFPPLADKHQSQKAARRFLAQGKKRLARFLCPEATERQEILESLDCLLEGRSEHSCWDGLARDARPTATHPAAEIARLLRRRFGRLSSSQRQAFMEQGWSTFRSVAQRHLIWTSDQQSDQTVALPVLQLAAVLQPHRGLGSLAAEVVEMAWKNPRIHQPGWWRELVVGLQGCPRLDGLCAADDCPEAAYALTRAAVRQLAGDDKRAELACGHLDAAAEALPFLFSKNSEFFAQKSPKSS